MAEFGTQPSPRHCGGSTSTPTGGRCRCGAPCRAARWSGVHRAGEPRESSRGRHVVAGRGGVGGGARAAGRRPGCVGRGVHRSRTDHGLVFAGPDGRALRPEYVLDVWHWAPRVMGTDRDRRSSGVHERRKTTVTVGAVHPARNVCIRERRWSATPPDSFRLNVWNERNGAGHGAAAPSWAQRGHRTTPCRWRVGSDPPSPASGGRTATRASTSAPSPSSTPHVARPVLTTEPDLPWRACRPARVRLRRPGPHAADDLHAGGLARGRFELHR